MPDIRLQLAPEYHQTHDVDELRVLGVMTAKATADNMGCQLTSEESYHEEVLTIDPNKIDVTVERVGPESTLNHVINVIVEAVPYSRRLADMDKRLDRIKVRVAESAGVDVEKVSVRFWPTLEKHWV